MTGGAKPRPDVRLADLGAVVMRKDPPFDMEYVYSTHLLEYAQQQGAKVFNTGAAIRNHPEKLAITEISEFTAPTLVTRNMARLKAFHDKHQDVIVKPLDGMGGTGVFRLQPKDPNLNAILETLTDNGARTIMAQRYIPEIVKGDKRILLIGGEPVPYCLARIPLAGETRGNLAAGGRGVAQPLSPRDREIAEAVAPAGRPRPAAGRPGRHRRLRHRGQCHQPHLFRGDRRTDRLRRRRHVRAGARESSGLRPRDCCHDHGYCYRCPRAARRRDAGLRQPRDGQPGRHVGHPRHPAGRPA